MRKLYLTVAAAIMCATTAFSANYHGLKIALSDGTNVHINLSDELKATFTDTSLHIVTDSETTGIDVPRQNIVGLEFTEESAPVGVDEVTNDNRPVISGDNMIFRGLPDGSQLNVYTTDGKTIVSKTISGDYTLSLSELPAGVCIVNVNKMSYKINVK